MANYPNITRRLALQGALAAVAAPAVAYEAPITDEPLELPDWWKKLTSDTAHEDPEVFHPWPDTALNRELARTIQRLHDLMLEAAPGDIDTISDFRLHWNGGVPHGVIVTARSGAYGEGLHSFRPEFGWNEHTPRIGGAV